MFTIENRVVSIIVIIVLVVIIAYSNFNSSWTGELGVAMKWYYPSFNITIFTDFWARQ